MSATVAVIGGGSAGTMAVLRTVLNNNDCLFFPGSPQDKKASRALWVRKIENMPAHFHYKRGIEEPNAETLKWIDSSPFRDRLKLHRNLGIAKIEKNPQGRFVLQDHKGGAYEADFVILSTGVMDVQPLFEGKIDPIFPFANAQLIDYCLRCDGHHVLGKSTAVIGHGNGAAWVAVMLYERYRTPAMHLLSHGESFEHDATIGELIEMYGIQKHTAPIKKMLGDASTDNFEGFELSDGSVVDVSMAFVSLGMIVYNELAKQVGAAVDGRGFVLTDANGLSNVPGFYVAGDVMAGTKKQIYTAWDTAVNAADAINMKIRGQEREQALAAFRLKKT